MSVGLVGYMGIGVESSGGTASSSATIVDYLPFVSETLQVTRTDLPDPSIAAQWDERKMYGGQQTVGGGLQTIFHPTLSGYLLHTVFDVETAMQGFQTVSLAGLRDHRFTLKQTQFESGSGSDLPTLTIEMYRGPLLQATTAGSSFCYYNCTGNAGEIVLEAGQLVKVNVDLVGRDYGGIQKTAQTFAAPDGFTWNQASVAVVGQPSTLFSALTVRVENNLDQIPKLDGRLRADLLKRRDFRRVMVNGTLVFQTFSEWDRFTAGSEGRLLVTVTGSTATASFNNWLTIDVPRMRYSTLPVNISGPGPISISFTGRGMIDPTSGYACEVTMVNTRINAYTVNSTA